MRKLLIANRGEIACRIMRTARRLGIATVAVFSDADASSAHVRSADEAVRIGPPDSKLSYLSIDTIIAVARASGADAIHPGYGFLAENAAFARRARDEGLVFVGPPPEVIESLGDKLRAKELAAKTSVPTVPSLAIGLSPSDLAQGTEFARSTGFPLLVKASAGGGGRGMRRVSSIDELSAACESAAREALAAFGDGRLFLEKLVFPARHVEVQFMADAHGNVAILSDRDCSMQRHHQKVLEEAPAPNLSAETRAALHSGARRLVTAAGYRNAGTAEFLVDAQGAVYFLEVNSRLQVEHPVTEAVTGLDLVELQLRVAEGADLRELLAHGEQLDALATSARTAGCAVEARICAEMPERGFLASTGTLLHFGPGTEAPYLRWDTGFEAGDAVSHHYDSLLGKLIVHAPTRDEARMRLANELARFRCLGVASNVGFLVSLVESAPFRDVTHHVTCAAGLLASPETLTHRRFTAAALAAVAEVVGGIRLDGLDPFARGDLWTLRGPARYATAKSIDDEIFSLGVESLSRTADTASFRAIRPASAERAELKLDLRVRLGAAGGHRIVLEGVELPLDVVRSASGELWAGTPWGPFLVRDHHPKRVRAAGEPQAGVSIVTAHLPGKIARLCVDPGATVDESSTLVVIESMKMEHVIRPERKGTVAAIHCAAGQVVNLNAPLLELNYD